MADYLIHYNKNHSKANGQFISGDGDGDGVVNDHANQYKKDHRAAANMRTNGKKMLKRGLIMKGTSTALLATSSISKHLSRRVSDNNPRMKAGLAYLSSISNYASIPFNVLGTTGVIAGAVTYGRGSARLENLENNKQR